MTTIVTRLTKGSPLTWIEADANFTNLNTDKAPVDSPNLTGVPIAPTATNGTNTTQLATTAFVQAKTATQTPSTAIGNIVATNVQAALEELDTEKATITTFSGSSGSSLVGFIQAGTGAVARTVQNKARETISAADFGAVGDGTTDDTAALQAAIDYCATFTRWPTLELTGRHKITSSLIIDRLVDNALSEFRIVANGIGAGFYVTSGVTIFDSTITITVDPKCEWVTFEGVQFESSSVANAAYVMSEKFLRCKFLNCNFRLMRFINSSIYVQTLYFENCNLRNWPGYFINCAGLYDVSFQGCVIENGTTLVRCVAGARGTNGLRIINNVIEGLQGSTLLVTGCAGLVVSGNHIESNQANDYNLFSGVLTNKSVSIVGNYIYNPLGATFLHGPAVCVMSSGNTCSPSYLHANSSAVTDLISLADNPNGGAGVADATVKSTINGVTRYGNASDVWSGNANQITKDAAGRFGFGIGALAAYRATFLGEDTSNSKYALAAFDSGGNTIAAFRNDRQVLIPVLGNYANDAAAAVGGVSVGALYRNGSVVMTRVV